MQHGFVIGKLSLLHPRSQQIAKDSAEIFMPGIRQEAAGIGEHANKASQKRNGSQTRQLILHAVLGIVEPPGGAMLHLPLYPFALEGSGQRVQHGIIVGVQRVQNSFREAVFLIQIIQKGCQGYAAIAGADAVIAAIRSQAAKSARVGVAKSAIMKLHHPAAGGVLFSQKTEQKAFVAILLPL